MLGPWPRKLPKEKVDAAGGDGMFIWDAILVVLGITAAFGSPSSLKVVPEKALSTHSHLPFEEVNSEDPKSSVMNIDVATS